MFFIHRHHFTKITIFLLLFLIVDIARAYEFPLPIMPDNMVGEMKLVQSQEADTIYQISRRYEVGSVEVQKANPRIRMTLPSHSPVVIPSFFILPQTVYEGIVVNLPEMRLYYYPHNSSKVITEPVAVGRIGWGTPEITSYVHEKLQDPIWFVPPGIKEYNLSKGEVLPDLVLPGYSNPLGQYALRLGVWYILIHGTNDPTTIGRRISSGCIRMYPEDIYGLYQIVPLKTAVYIIDQPYKVGWHREKLYIEVHEPLLESQAGPEREQEIIIKLIKDKIDELNRGISVNWQAVGECARKKSGIPCLISI